MILRSRVGMWIGRTMGPVAVLTTVLTLAAPTGVNGLRQTVDASMAGADSVAAPGSELTVYLVTAGPGDLIWERFGHDGLWIHDASTGRDYAWHWGVFDFTSSDYLPRLINGDMRYWMAAVDPNRLLEAYAGMDRSILRQELNLTPAQRSELLRIVRENDTEEHRYYTYDYYLDNCSTRIRDALNAVTGGRIEDVFRSIQTETTFRSHTRRILHDEPLYYTGIQVVLSQRADDPLTAWEESFLPGKLASHLNAVTVPGADGGEAPFVLSEEQLSVSSRTPQPETPPSRFMIYLGIGLAGAALLWFLGGNAVAGRGVLARLPLFLFGGLWAFLAGIGGVVLVFAWGFTNHTFWHWNENLMQLTPIHLLLLLPLTTLLLRGGIGVWGRRVALAVVSVSVFGFVIQLLPGFDQVNREVMAFALPLNVTLGLFLLSAPTTDAVRPA